MSAARQTAACTAIYVAQTFVVAALLTAAFMLLTATELGPMGPLVIALALYLGAFAFLIEVGLAAKLLADYAKGVAAQRPGARARRAS